MKIYSRLLTTPLVIFITILFPIKVFAADVTNSWFTTASLPYNLASHVSFWNGNKAFVLDGSAVTGSSHNQIIVATKDPSGVLSPWATEATFPTALIFHTIARHENKIYILGGREENPGSALDHVNKVFVGDISNLSSWATTTALPTNRSLGAAVVAGDRIFFSGGFNNSGTSDKVYSAPINPDGTLGSWIEAGTMPGPRFGHGMIEHNGNLIILGGYSGSSYQDGVYKATINPDGTISGFSVTSSLPSTLYRAGVVKIENQVYTVGGSNSTTELKKIYYADLGNDGSISSWNTSSNELPLAVSAGSVAVVKDYLYITGGFRGGSYLSSVYGTKLNITVDPDLAVPVFKQTDPAWGSQIYDTANLWSSSTGVSAWGCAMTSAAMVFNYHGITKLPDGQTLDPGKLNTWLKNQPDGYVGTGWVNWLALSRLSKLAKPQNPSFSYDGLEYDRKSGFADSQLTSDLENNIPGILEVSGGPEGQHFVVGKGIEDGKFLINDPYYNRNDLASYNNTFKSLGRFVPSNTDLSYIMLTISNGVSLIVKDQFGNEVGEGFLQEPLDNDEGDGGSEELHVYYIQKPSSGEFTVEVSAGSVVPYDIKQYLYDADGNVKITSLYGISEKNKTDVYMLSYNKENLLESDSISRTTFKSLLSDLEYLWDKREIKEVGTYLELKKEIKLAESYAESKRGESRARQRLQSALSVLEHSGGSISETAKNILKPQVEYLLYTL